MKGAQFRGEPPSSVRLQVGRGEAPGIDPDRQATASRAPSNGEVARIEDHLAKGNRAAEERRDLEERIKGERMQGIDRSEAASRHAQLLAEERFHLESAAELSAQSHGIDMGAAATGRSHYDHELTAAYGQVNPATQQQTLGAPATVDRTTLGTTQVHETTHNNQFASGQFFRTSNVLESEAYAAELSASRQTGLDSNDAERELVEQRMSEHAKAADRERWNALMGRRVPDAEEGHLFEMRQAAKEKSKAEVSAVDRSNDSSESIETQERAERKGRLRQASQQRSEAKEISR